MAPTSRWRARALLPEGFTQDCQLSATWVDGGANALSRSAGEQQKGVIRSTQKADDLAKIATAADHITCARAVRP